MTSLRGCLVGRALFTGRFHFQPVVDLSCFVAVIGVGVYVSFAVKLFCENNDFHDDGKTRTQVLSTCESDLGQESLSVPCDTPHISAIITLTKPRIIIQSLLEHG